MVIHRELWITWSKGVWTTGLAAKAGAENRGKKREKGVDGASKGYLHQSK